MTSTIDQGEDNDMVDLSSVDEDEDGTNDLTLWRRTTWVT